MEGVEEMQDVEVGVSQEVVQEEEEAKLCLVMEVVVMEEEVVQVVEIKANVDLLLTVRTGLQSVVVLAIARQLTSQMETPMLANVLQGRTAPNGLQIVLSLVSVE